MASVILLREEFDKCRSDQSAGIRHRTPTAQLNWGYNPKKKVLEINNIHQVVEELKEAGMSADDLVATFISRQVSSL